MNRDRQQDNRDDEKTVERELPDTTCKGFGPPPEIADNDQEGGAN